MICFKIKIIKLLRRGKHSWFKEWIISVKIVNIIVIIVHVKCSYQFTRILKLLSRNHRLFNIADWCFFNTRRATGIVYFLINLLSLFHVINHWIFIISKGIFICDRSRNTWKFIKLIFFLFNVLSLICQDSLFIIFFLIKFICSLI